MFGSDFPNYCLFPVMLNSNTQVQFTVGVKVWLYQILHPKPCVLLNDGLNRLVFIVSLQSVLWSHWETIQVFVLYLNPHTHTPRDASQQPELLWWAVLASCSTPCEWLTSRCWTRRGHQTRQQLGQWQPSTRSLWTGSDPPAWSGALS